MEDNYIRNYFKIYALVAIVVSGIVLVSHDAYATYTHHPEVKIVKDNTEMGSFAAYAESFTGGVHVAVADMGSDGTPEIITAAGPGGAPHVRVLRQDGSEISHFFAYDTGMHSGITVTVGDLDNDGTAEIVTAPQLGGAPHVRVFDMNGNPKFTPGFFAYDENFRGGVSLAIGDPDGDGYNEIITGAGPGGGPHVRVFDRFGQVEDNIFPFHYAFRGGVNVGVANVDGGQEDELLVGVASGDVSWVKVLKRAGQNIELKSFTAFGDTFKGGVRVTGGDVDGDGMDEVITAAGATGGPQVLAYEGYGKPVNVNFFAYTTDFRGGVNVAAGDFDGDGIDETVTGPSAWMADGRVDLPRYVTVDLSEQRLYAYENGRLIKTFLVSTGLPGTPTNPGTFHISQKIYSHLYSGPDYYFPNTLYNLRFDGSRLLHGAFWHNNFGHPMSHGCVNISYTNAAWLYDWMQIGDTVIVER